jgi:hypothetical protein
MKQPSLVARLPFQVKLVIALVGLAALTGVGIYVYQKLKKIGQNRDERQEGKAAKDELKELEDQGVKPTFTQAEAEAKCNALVTAATNCDMFGTGATEIMNIIYSVKNKADWFFLSSTFGVRNWTDCFGGASGSLTTLILEELDTPQMAEVRRHLGQIPISI